MTRTGYLPEATCDTLSIRSGEVAEWLKAAPC